MDLYKNQPEHKEPLPRPAIIETFDERQNRNNQLSEKERSEMFEKLLNDIKNKTQLSEDNEPIL